MKVIGFFTIARYKKYCRKCLKAFCYNQRELIKFPSFKFVFIVEYLDGLNVLIKILLNLSEFNELYLR